MYVAEFIIFKNILVERIDSIETILGKELISKIGLRRWNTKTKVKAKHPFEEEFNQIL